MTRFKIRLWDKENELWVLPDTLKLKPNKNGGCTEYDNDRFVLELGTGVKDITGREIYEGDIVSWIGHPMTGPGDLTGAIEFQDGSFVIAPGDEKSSSTEGVPMATINSLPLFEIEEAGLTVLGNVHENPELLEVEDD
ncbi:hypothetical protein GPK34_01040 [Secundilactobacillus kimchicus]|uniref:YopX family protein n=1 Tax=Secundilactobacillus kimchicus TaxID=528209 RepID=UPI001C0358CF|nr:YopX family protein [Secundilactobacillus kimchicus]MBT9670623.1 hypothetical protein [Secundilactobacillus kimchicus]